ncbi:MAG: DNA-directed RNA polymerase subunit omega [Bdellovibrionales bacterium]|nr:DNA-directed RNA polymerase subunit omega [Bdellovibrionales bacterium]
MARVTVEDCLDKVSNRFTLVILVAKRVRQFLNGDQPLVSANNKYVVNALREVAAGAVDTNLSKEDMALKLESILKRDNTSATSSKTVAKEDG